MDDPTLAFSKSCEMAVAGRKPIFIDFFNLHLTRQEQHCVNCNQWIDGGSLSERLFMSAARLLKTEKPDQFSCH